MTRLLYLTTVPPWPPTIGGRQRSNLLYRALSTVADADVACIFPSGGIDPDHLRETAAHCNFVGWIQWNEDQHDARVRAARYVSRGLGYPRSLELLKETLLKDRQRFSANTDAVAWLAEQLRSTSYNAVVSRFLLPVFKTKAAQLAPVLVDVDDLYSRHYETRAEQDELTWHARAVYRASAARCRRRERATLAQCQHAWFVAAQDQSRFPAMASTSLLPNIPFVPEGSVSREPCAERTDSRLLLTVGSLGYEPNRAGVDWFLREVWPHIHFAEREASYWIVGKAGSADQQRWSTVPGVSVLGSVDDLHSVYESSAFTVAPILIGAGTKIKVLESLAFQRCCVATPHALYGYDELLSGGKGAYCADSAEHMVDVCLHLLRSPQERAAQALAGRQFVEHKYSYASFARQVQDDLMRVLSGSRERCATHFAMND